MAARTDQAALFARQCQMAVADGTEEHPSSVADCRLACSFQRHSSTVDAGVFRRYSWARRSAVFTLLMASAALAQTPGEVLVVVNRRSATSRQIGEYYLHKRDIPLANLCVI